VLVLGAIQNALLPDLPRPLAVLIGNMATVTVLTWLLMPRVTAWLHEWLRR
jgi:antibiotic biosynthesis monooxygenase (ABM) superfamily enzyme